MGKAFLFKVPGSPASRDTQQKYTRKVVEGRILAPGDCRWRAQPSHLARRSLKCLEKSQNTCWQEYAPEAELFWRCCSYCTRLSCLSWQWARNQPAAPSVSPAELVTPPGGVRGRSCRTAWEMSVVPAAKIDHGKGEREAQPPNPLASHDNFPAETEWRCQMCCAGRSCATLILVFWCCPGQRPPVSQAVWIYVF